MSQTHPQTPRESGTGTVPNEKEEGWLERSGLGGVSRFLEQLLSPAPSPATDPICNAGESTTATATTPPQDCSGATNVDCGEEAVAGKVTGRANGQSGPPSSTHESQNTARTTHEQDTFMGPRRCSLQTEDSCEKHTQFAQASGRWRAPIKVLYSRAIGVDKAVQTLPYNVDPSASEQTIKLYSQEGISAKLAVMVSVSALIIKFVVIVSQFM